MPDFPAKIHELEFDKVGSLVRPSQLEELKAHLTGNNITDLIVMSHGWNNDMAEARDLYRRLRDRLAAQAANVPGVAQRRVALAGVLWPSKRFTDKELIPGGAASAAGVAANPIIEDQLQVLEDLLGSDAVPADFARARALIPKLQEGNTGAQVEFAQLVLKYLPPGAVEDGDFYDEGVVTSGKLGDEPLLEVLGRPAPLAPPPSRGGAAMIREDRPPPASRGGAAGIGDLFAGVKAGAMNLLNLTTYYTMKERAGTVGRSGMAQVLRALRASQAILKLHLVGHSFGGRLVTAAALGPEGQPSVKVGSLSLLQAAYSHYGLSRNYRGSGKDGFFRRVLSEQRVTGPVVITHTRNDTAVGVAYAVASRVARQIAAALGDEHDAYGGMGSNGAQDTPERLNGTLEPPGVAYQFQAGKVYNLKADQSISSHSDVANDATAYAVLSAVAVT